MEKDEKTDNPPLEKQVASEEARLALARLAFELRRSQPKLDEFTEEVIEWSD